MSVALPWVLWLTAAAMAGVIAAHLLAVGVPTRLELPTARFVPVERASAVSRARTPTDRGLLLLRLLALALVGAAFAGLRCAESRVSRGRLLVLDGAAGDSTTAWRRAVDAAFADSIALLGVVWRDGPSAVRATPLPDDVREALRIGAVPDSPLARDARSGGAGAPGAARNIASSRAWRDAHTLTGALLRARRAAMIAARGADSVRLEVVTRRRGDATTAALGAVRATWPGVIVLHDVAIDSSVLATDSASALTDQSDRADGASPSDTSWRIEQASAGADDPVALALRRWRAQTADATSVTDAPLVRVSRVTATARDDASASGDSRVPARDDAWSPDDSSVLAQGGVVVRWPARARDDRASAPRPADGVVAYGLTLVAPVSRVWARDTAPRAASARSSDAASPVPIAWFLDGDVAIDETTIGDGCVRDVYFTPPGGDLLLDPSARGVLAALASTCGRRAPPATPAVASATLFTSSPDGSNVGPWVARRALVPSDDARTAPDHARLLLLLALLLLLIEQWWRGARPTGAPAASRRRP
jgi:hypothetical protein